MGIPWNCATIFLDPFQDSRTTAQSSLESSSSADVFLVNLSISRIFSSRLPVRGHYCTTRYPKCRNTLLKRQYSCCAFLSREQFLIQCLVGDIFGPRQSLKSHSVCVCVCAKHRTQTEPYYPLCYFREQSCLWHRIQSRALFCRHEKEKREQLVSFRTVFALYFVVHLTVTYTGRLSSLVL